MNSQSFLNNYISAKSRASELYSDDNEKYHTIHHVNYMLALASRHWEEFHKIHGFPTDEEKNALIMSIIFHDCVYVPGSNTNEEDSADEADSFLRMCGYGKPFISSVTNLILSTKQGAKLDNDLKKFLHDLDWSGFVTYEEMLDNEKKIFKECRDAGFLLLDVFRGRLQFYVDLDNAKADIFHSVFRKYNSIAKSNISKRIVEWKYSV